MPPLLGCCGAVPIRRVSTTGSGVVLSSEHGIADLDELDVGNAFEVGVSQGDTYRVIVGIEDNRERYLEVDKQGRRLRIGLEPGRAYILSNATLEVEVTMPALSGLTLSGAAS